MRENRAKKNGDQVLFKIEYSVLQSHFQQRKLRMGKISKWILNSLTVGAIQAQDFLYQLNIPISIDLSKFNSSFPT